MYTAFNIKIDTFVFENITHYINIGNEQKKIFKNTIINDLNNYVLSNEILDGNKLMDTWFKSVNCDIFLSHSHNDIDLALAFAGYLKETFDLSVFLDEIVWSSADELLKIIDDKYAFQETSKTYNYKKRNLTTSHVHSMLSTSVQTMMDNCEVVFFLNTNESFPNIEDVVKENSEYTLSPWIFQEVMFAKHLRKTHWSNYRKRTILEHAAYESSNFKIAYKTPINDFTTLDVDDINNWYENYRSHINEPYGGFFLGFPNHPLNFLYEMVFEKDTN